jgi:hypothetical protein
VRLACDCRWFRLHLQLLAPTNTHWAHVVGYGSFFSCVICKEAMCSSSIYGRCGVVVGILAYYARGRGPHSTNICVHEHVCLYWVWVFLCYNMYVFTKQSIYVSINPLSRFHNTSLISSYFGLDSRECKCLEY